MSQAGKDILERARAHMRGMPTKKIIVPQWPDADGNPTIIYAGPLTLYERNQIYKGAKGDDLAVFATAIVLKATDEKGTRLFDIGDKHTLLRELDSTVITLIGSEIIKTEPGELDVENLAGN